ncbi:queuosine precursor transporter [Brevibacillus formosus]|uniref:Probable queuosine precursor transporter n=1 Tax=Brevibacillus formosus TaxID=54913 RepID=A0A837KMN1_9BACL|nr:MULTISPECIES: queuosine precursor transporter [Brevibacillus]KLH98261.1 membrane protein [Brevibacillus formosus]MBG9943567.1 membrane protein [Brevibacillus formosus]MBW5467872.1 queuosine precursor transporter [Brevibacillus formosus]MED1948122.1 queuosine precursor transporter [Brevibacillus formosus]MED1957073.1 queuosine precursor transporter [Brevibacillus formosus]
MFNFWIGVLFALVNFGLFLLCYRFFGRMGLYAWIGMATVLANIQVVKTIEMFGLVMTLGNTIYASIYLISDLLNEKYGEREAKKAVWFGFFTLIAATIIMQLVLVFEPQETDIAQGSLQTIFGLMPRVALGSLCAYFVSQFVDVKIYSWLKKKCPGPNQLWIRNNGSTLFSQLLDSVTFCTIAFLGEFPMDVWWQILLTTYLIKFVVSAASTPVLYIARSMKVDES